MPTSQNAAAVQTLRKISPELAAASLSYDTGEPADLRSAQPNIGTDIMIARIEDSPKRAVRSDYADAGLRFGNRVSADYTFNFIPSRSVFSILAHPTGAALVQYSIEIDPQNFSMETNEEQSKFYTTLDLTIEARSDSGELVVATDKEAYIELTPSQMREIQAHPFAYQDNFALVAGRYTVSVIVRNRVLTQYTVAEAEIVVPRFEPGRPALTGTILAYDTRVEDGDFENDFVYTYQVGGLRIHPAAENLFVIGDTAHLVAQVFSGSPDLRIVFELEERDGPTLERLETTPEASGLAVDHLRLGSLEGGEYLVTTTLVDPSDTVLAETTAPLTVSPRSVSPRPGFVYRRGLNMRVPGLLSYMLGDQFSNLGKLEDARVSYEASITSGSETVLATAGWKLANLYLKQNQPDDALRVLEPLEGELSDRYEVVAGIGFARYLKVEHVRAAEYLEKARALGPPDTMLLNALGDSLQQLGNVAAAREAFESSLELDPEQAAVKERLRAFSSEPPSR